MSTCIFRYVLRCVSASWKWFWNWILNHCAYFVQQGRQQQNTRQQQTTRQQQLDRQLQNVRNRNFQNLQYPNGSPLVTSGSLRFAAQAREGLAAREGLGARDGLEAQGEIESQMGPIAYGNTSDYGILSLLILLNDMGLKFLFKWPT
jgi:hypothetical protein